MNLQPFCFPVVERVVAVDNAKTPLIDIQDQDSFLPNGYKAIVREDTNEVISIVRDSYKIVTNSELIDQLLRQLATCGHSFRIDPSHSFVSNERMRLQITFPELKLRDQESEIALSAFIHNSYDQSEGVRFYFGAIRAICSNGMVFGQVLSKYYSRHTKGFSFENLGEKLTEAREYFPEIQERINRLEVLRVDEQLVENISEKISKRLAQEAIDEQEIGRISQWMLLNRLTNRISHEMEPHVQARYQDKVSKVFAL
ncbi:DUF932 domain-containing protein [Gracilimonas sp.]|uniref:DUF932 domain-containing protein n=1 Tax=Gracilimonas sp. TaxID=1974203 RepID=UPI0032EF2D70